jgi:DNA polymerase V
MTWGGKRAGSGRPSGSGKYGVKTLPIRVPVNKIKQIKQFIQSQGSVNNLN